MSKRTGQDIVLERERFQQDLHDHSNTDPQRLDRTLFATVDALVAARIPYALIGGVAVKGLGRPRVTHDIDIFVSPDDAERVLEILANNGFETEKRDPHWLFKAWREDVLVDIVFKSTGDIYFDEEMQRRVKPFQYQGRTVHAISPEDFIVIKSAVHREHSPHHWHDALAVLTHGDLDWAYLLKRSRHTPRRVLSLLVYAQSNDLRVPNEVIRQLFRKLYESGAQLREANSNSKSIEDELRRIRELERKHTQKTRSDEQKENAKEESTTLYLEGHLKELLASDDRTADQDIVVLVNQRKIVVRGDVVTPSQKEAVRAVVAAALPKGYEFENQVRIRQLGSPEGSEAVL